MILKLNRKNTEYFTEAVNCENIEGLPAGILPGGIIEIVSRHVYRNGGTPDNPKHNPGRILLPNHWNNDKHVLVILKNQRTENRTIRAKLSNMFPVKSYRDTYRHYVNLPAGYLNQDVYVIRLLPISKTDILETS